MKLYTAGQMRRTDDYNINELSVPSITLMERASNALGRCAAKYMSSGAAAVFCGSGNNGGDGIGAAIYLVNNTHLPVRVFMVGSIDTLTKDTSVMAARLEAAGGKLEFFDAADEETVQYVKQCDVLIDALLGTGLSKPLSGAYLQAAELMNSSSLPVIAADIPSGVSADTGECFEGAVKADETVTFAGAKIGQFLHPGSIYCGKITIADIGAAEPPDIKSDTFAVTDINGILPPRRPDAHKGDFGRDLIIAGSIGFTGAASMASHSAVRSGAGLVELAVPEAVYGIEAVKNDEAMVTPLPSDENGRLNLSAYDIITQKLKKCGACLIGPGLGRSEELTKLVHKVISASSVPLVIDADGINAVSENINVLDTASCPIVLTPHDGEFARLTGGAAVKDRVGAARDFAVSHGVTLVLKGHRTITAFPDGTVCVNTTGNVGMAKGGSGDVLAGIMVSLIGQGLPWKEAVTASVYIHGKAGDICRDMLGEYTMTPCDIINNLYKVMR